MALAPAPALALLSLLPGLAIGSFLGVLAARMPLRRPVVRSRSACLTCDAVLAWYDNIPLLSFALLRGRCRRCRTPIPLREPAVELAGGLVIAGSVLAFGLTVQAVAAAVFSAALVVVSATDLLFAVLFIAVPPTPMVASRSSICRAYESLTGCVVGL